MSSITTTTNLAPLQMLLEQIKKTDDDISYNSTEQRFVFISRDTTKPWYSAGSELIEKLSSLMQGVKLELDLASALRLNYNLDSILKGASYEISPKFNSNITNLLPLLQYLNTNYQLLSTKANKRLTASFINNFDASLLSTEDLQKFFIKLISLSVDGRFSIGPKPHAKFKPLTHYLAEHPDYFITIYPESTSFYSRCSVTDLNLDDLHSLDRISFTLNNPAPQLKPSTREEYNELKWLAEQKKKIKEHFFSLSKDSVEDIQNLIEKKINSVRSVLDDILSSDLVNIIMAYESPIESLAFLTGAIQHDVEGYISMPRDNGYGYLHTFSSRSCQVTVDPIMRTLFSTLSHHRASFFLACLKNPTTWLSRPDFVQKAIKAIPSIDGLDSELIKSVQKLLPSPAAASNDT